MLTARAYLIFPLHHLLDLEPVKLLAYLAGHRFSVQLLALLEPLHSVRLSYH